jgi:hypothetical protein
MVGSRNEWVTLLIQPRPDTRPETVEEDEVAIQEFLMANIDALLSKLSSPVDIPLPQNMVTGTPRPGDLTGLFPLD